MHVHIHVGMTDVDEDCVPVLMCLFHMCVHVRLAIVREMVMWYMNAWLCASIGLVYGHV